MGRSWGLLDGRGLSFSVTVHIHSDKDNYFGSYTIEDGRIRLGGVLMSDLVYSYKLDGDTLICIKKILMMVMNIEE